VCEDGERYLVGDQYNFCGSLNCTGGFSKYCIKRTGPWSGKTVRCGMNLTGLKRKALILETCNHMRSFVTFETINLQNSFEKNSLEAQLAVMMELEQSISLPDVLHWNKNLQGILAYDLKEKVGFSAPNPYMATWRADFFTTLKNVQDSQPGDNSWAQSIDTLKDQPAELLDACWAKSSKYGKAWCLGG
jgi:hypothetical protein